MFLLGLYQNPVILPAFLLISRRTNTERKKAEGRIKKYQKRPAFIPQSREYPNGVREQAAWQASERVSFVNAHEKQLSRKQALQKKHSGESLHAHLL